MVSIIFWKYIINCLTIDSNFEWLTELEVFAVITTSSAVSKACSLSIRLCHVISKSTKLEL